MHGAFFHVFSFRERDRISLYTGQFLLTKELFIPKNCLFLSVDFPKDDTPDRTGARIPKGNHLQETEGLRRWCMSGWQPGRTKLDPDVHGFDVGGARLSGPRIAQKTAFRSGGILRQSQLFPDSVVRYVSRSPGVPSPD